MDVTNRHEPPPRRMRPSRPLACALALLVVVAACGEKSRVDPNAQVRVTGSAVGVDGAPLSDRPVHLGAGISDSEVGLAIFTVGLSCTAGGCRGKQVDTKTDATGSFAFTLKGSDSQSTFGEAVSELVTASAAPGPGQVSGAAVSARFKIQTEAVALPALRLVDPGLALDQGKLVAARWSTPAPGPYALTFEDGTARPVWQVTTAEPAASVDRRVLEDTAGRAVVSGSSTDQIEGSALDVRWRSPGVGYAGTGAPPPSRGQTCRYVDAAGATVAPTRCALTDGDLVTAASAPGCAAAAPSSSTAPSSAPGCERPVAVDIVLGAAVPAELVVVRGCAAACAVAVSADGATFTPAGAAEGDDAVVALGGAPITTVRVALAPDAADGLREVSVWGPAPTGEPVADDAAVRDLRSRFGGGGGDDGPPVAVVLVAGVLVAGLLVALGVLIGRRRTGSGPLPSR